ncbi:MAG TPA: hypothetical protein VGK19_16630 [Capsulimonadaceae bacterium]|jgi:hypothetical protein
MTVVKVTTCSPDWPLAVQTPNGDGRWGDIEFRKDDDTDVCDWWIIGDDPTTTQTATCPPERTVLITWEPPSCKPYPESFTRQFHHVITCHAEIKHPRKHIEQQGFGWHLRGISYRELQSSPDKTRSLSVIR